MREVKASEAQLKQQLELKANEMTSSTEKQSREANEHISSLREEIAQLNDSIGEERKLVEMMKTDTLQR